MSDWPSSVLRPLRVVHTLSSESLGGAGLGWSSSAIGAQTITSLQAYYVPFRVDVQVTAVKLFYVTGAIVAGGIDMGLYDSQFNTLVTLGSTAMGAANTLQECDIADTNIGPGRYWIGFSAGGTTVTFFGQNASDEVAQPQTPFYIQASAFPLPTVGTAAVPVKSTAAVPQLPLLGVSFNTLI